MTSRRPIQEVAADVRRLAAEVDRGPVEGAQASAGATALAYDAALREACAALGVRERLAAALRRGDVVRERERVERALTDAGLAVRPDV